MLDVTDEGITYDHASAEAVVFVTGCLDNLDDPVMGLLLTAALEQLEALPVPTGRGVLMARIRGALAARGHRLPAYLQAV
jgi:hypothetical protein